MDAIPVVATPSRTYRRFNKPSYGPYGDSLLDIDGRSSFGYAVATSTADPSTFHAIDLSLLKRVPKIDQVVPPLVEIKNGGTPSPKVPASICAGLTGLTAMLGSEF